MWDAERAELLAAVREMDRLGLVSGSSGNASVRLVAEPGAEAYLITPAGVPYPGMTAADLVAVDGELEPLEGDGVPSSESLLHLAIYRARPDVGSVMHTHSVCASALSVTGTPIPPVVDELVMYVGGQVEVAEYGFPGTPELADRGVQALGERAAVLLRHHGMCAVGKSPAAALRVCELVERVAQIYIHAQALGGARVLPDDALEAEAAVYRMRAGLHDAE